MSVLGCDYAWERPSPAALAAAGYRFACRYLSYDTTGKNLTLYEAKALAAQGVSVVANWEWGAADATTGSATGATHARVALRQAANCGMPAGRPVYYSVDVDVPASAVTDYFRGVNSVHGGPATVGAYGSSAVIEGLRAAGLIAWEWRTMSTGWAGGANAPHANIVQTGSTHVAGLGIDVNQALTADYGQWTPGSTSTGDSDMTPEEHAMLADVQARVNAIETLPQNRQNALAWHLNAISQGRDVWANQDVPNGLPQIKAAIDALSAKVGGLAQPAVDAKALAAALAPLLTSGATAEQVASAVVAHLAADLAKG